MSAAVDHNNKINYSRLPIARSCISGCNASLAYEAKSSLRGARAAGTFSNRFGSAQARGALAYWFYWIARTHQLEHVIHKTAGGELDGVDRIRLRVYLLRRLVLSTRRKRLLFFPRCLEGLLITSGRLAFLLPVMQCRAQSAFVR